MAAAVGRLTQTITIVDKSNRVVGASKQLKDVFHEAKHAYLERKAEIKAERKKREEVELQKAIAASVVGEEERNSDATQARPQRHTRTRESVRRRRTSVDSSRVGDTPREVRNSRSTRHGEADGNSSPRSVGGHGNRSHSRSAPTSPIDNLDVQPNQLIRRSKTDIELPTRPQLARSRSTPDVDMDLAYGEFHAGDLRSLSQKPNESQLSQDVPSDPKVQQQELSSLVTKCQLLLDEANCAQHSARKIVSHLQSNPEAMAAVGLTLAEISNVASKMAPGALAMFSKSAPAVMALLASPQFLIAVGVGIGVTVIMFGGYKIIKKIKAAKAAQDSSEDLAFGAEGQKIAMDEALDVRELDRIEHWRRGIADAHAESLIEDDRHTVCSAATSVEGEFITPYAARSMGHLPLQPNEKKSKKDKESEKDQDKERKRREKKEKKEKKPSSSSKKFSREVNDGDDEDSSTTASETTTTATKSNREGRTIKVKKPSPLRRMFASGTSEKV